MLDDDGSMEGDDPADSGQPTKPARTILRQEVVAGAEQLQRPARGLFLSAVSAGVDIGFGPLMVVAVFALAPTESLSRKLVVAFVYAIGFVIVILGRSELFTEHTTLAVLPLLSGDASLRQVSRLWVLVYVGNLVGVVAFVLLAAPLGLTMGMFDEVAAQAVAHELVDMGAWAMVGSGVLAGLLMGLVSWLVAAARETIGQVVMILLGAGAIAFLGLHHSIAGSVEVLIGVVASDVPVVDYGRFLVASTLGNAIGGIFLVALLKYGHVTEAGTRRDQE